MKKQLIGFNVLRTECQVYKSKGKRPWSPCLSADTALNISSRTETRRDLRDIAVRVLNAGNAQMHSRLYCLFT